MDALSVYVFSLPTLCHECRPKGNACRRSGTQPRGWPASNFAQSTVETSKWRGHTVRRLLNNTKTAINVKRTVSTTKTHQSSASQAFTRLRLCYLHTDNGRAARGLPESEQANLKNNTKNASVTSIPASKFQGPTVPGLT